MKKNNLKGSAFECKYCKFIGYWPEENCQRLDESKTCCFYHEHKQQLKALEGIGK